MRLASALLWLGLTPGLVRADPAPVLVLVTTDGPRDEGLAVVVEERLTALGFRTVWAATDAPFDPARMFAGSRADAALVARVWTDRSLAGTLGLYVFDGAGARVALRSVPVPETVDEVTREEIGLIVASVVEALATGRERGMSRAEAATVLADAAVPARPARPARAPGAGPRGPPSAGRAAALDAAATYEPAAWDETTLVHAVGLTARVELPELAVGASVRAHLPLTRSADSIELGLAGVGLDAWVETPRVVGLAVRAGVGARLLRARAVVRGTAGLEPAAAAWALDPVARVAATLRTWLTAGWGIEVGGGVDLDLVRIRYRVEDGDSIESWWNPWRARPFLALSLVRRLLP